MQAQSGMAVFVVIPREEDLAVQSGGLDRVEPAGEVGPVLQRLELGLRVIRRLNADAGSQYTSVAFTQRLLDEGIDPSVGSVGDALDKGLAS
jgi:transposase InsO family protein